MIDFKKYISFTKSRPKNYKNIKSQIKKHKDDGPINILFDGNSTELNEIFQLEKIQKAFNDSKSSTILIELKQIEKFIDDFIKKFISKIQKSCLIAAWSEQKISFFWKIKDEKIHQFGIEEGIINFKGLDVKETFEFIASKLKEAIDEDFKAFSEESSKSEIHNVILKNKENLFTAAIKENNLKVLNFLIRTKKFEINNEICYHNENFITPAQLACSLHKPEAFLFLIKNDSKFPDNFYLYRDEMEQKCEDLKKLIAEFEELHQILESLDDCNSFDKNNEKIVKEFDTKKERFRAIFDKCSDYSFCYDTENKSLVFHALILEKFKLEKLLTEKSKRYGPHETREIGKINSEKVKENFIKARKLQDAHVRKLIYNSRLDENLKQVTEKHGKVIEKVFKYLNKLEKVMPILRLIASCEDFKIVFDRSRENLSEFMRIKNNKNNNVYGAIFWKDGNIVISAKDLFEPRMMEKICEYKFSFDKTLEPKVPKIIGTLVHELGHCMMMLIFGNKCKPYAIGNGDEFIQIVNEIKEISDRNEKNNQIDENESTIVGSVFKYSEQDWHAELAVRPAQFYAQFSHQEKELMKYQEKFSKLFEYFHKILEKVEPTIKMVEKLNKKESEIVFEDLTDDYKINLQKMKIRFQGNLTRIDELLITNDNKLLHDVNVMKNNNKKTETIFEILNKTLQEIVKTMSSSEIQQVLDPNKILSIRSENNPPKFFIMKIKDNKNRDNIKNYKIIYNNIDENELNSLDCEKVKFSDYAGIRDENSNTFENLKNITFIKPIKITPATEIEIKAHHEIPTDVNLDETIRETMKAAESKKMLIIKDENGTGKTTTLNFIAALINKMQPKKFILQIDGEEFDKMEDNQNILKYLNELKDDEKLTEIIKFILEMILKINKNSFEANIFKNLFIQGQVVFFWDGCILEDINTIAPVIKQTNNEQWITLFDCEDDDEVKNVFNDVEMIKVKKLTGFDEMSEIGMQIVNKIEKILNEATSRNKNSGLCKSMK
ncbi:hypothetical protein PVAND_014699 [Polypedilum vanderplanki]|uniref:Uncharacterized protein n=1 Tax=Polypedilum vanderplanki TaxID=319348 RepID=A0A9J6BA46_POLVA|nr:hypothetical protein PVAND_014699 [Polypedilum vanderplanki]